MMENFLSVWSLYRVKHGIWDDIDVVARCADGCCFRSLLTPDFMIYFLGGKKSGFKGDRYRFSSSIPSSSLGRSMRQTSPHD